MGANRIVESCETLKTVDDQGRLIDLNATQLKIYQDFLEAMNSSLHDGTDDCVVYRGQKISTIAKIMGTTENDFSQVFYKLFIWGEKAKHYYSGPTNFLEKIDNTSKESLEQIFNSIQSALRNKDSLIISIFKEKNPDFYNYFIDTENKEHFVNECSENQKAKLYYWFFLHTIGLNFSKESTLISTSVNKNVASRFANEGIKANDFPIIYHYYNKNGKSIDSTTVLEQIDPSVPRYKGITLYEKEEEKSVIGALFPHYIFCIELPKQNETVVNPWLFKQDDAQTGDEIFTKFKTNGLYIDQKDIDIDSIKYTLMVINSINGNYYDFPFLVN